MILLTYKDTVLPVRVSYICVMILSSTAPSVLPSLFPHSCWSPSAPMIYIIIFSHHHLHLEFFLTSYHFLYTFMSQRLHPPPSHTHTHECGGDRDKVIYAPKFHIQEKKTYLSFWVWFILKNIMIFSATSFVINIFLTVDWNSIVYMSPIFKFILLLMCI